jgi:TonB family protein
LPPAPVIAATGDANTSGMRADGVGPGAGTTGTGGGSGAGGAGQGGGGSALAQIAGTIDSARDYPRAGRDARIGHSALIVFTVGVDGRAHDCHVRESSGDPESDAITCRLAEQRFAFAPPPTRRAIRSSIPMAGVRNGFIERPFVPLTQGPVGPRLSGAGGENPARPTRNGSLTVSTIYPVLADWAARALISKDAYADKYRQSIEEPKPSGARRRRGWTGSGPGRS